LKDWRRRPEGGGVNGSQSKTSHGNLAYVPQLTQPASFPTRSRLRSYRQATSPRNWVRKPQITAKALIDTRQVTSEVSTTKIKPKEQLRVSRTFLRTPIVRDQETTLRVQQESKSSSLCLHRLKNNTGGHLQESSPWREINTASQAFR
jgi:hypothetical protein